MAAPEVQGQQKPRFKQELVAEPIDENGAKFIDVMDPDSGNVFRFYEVEYALACAMDGERDLAGIVKWAQEELGLTPSPAEVRTVIRTLGDLGYLEGGAVASQAPARPVEAARPIEVARPVERPIEVARPLVDATPPARPVVDAELARGVVVGQTARPVATPVEDFELGSSGGPATRAPVEDLPASPDYGLGKSGAAAAPKVPVAPVEDIALGQSGAGLAASTADMSLDLSDNMKIQLDDVKEAVRASKVMTAVEVPKELLEALEGAESKPAEAKVEAKPEAKIEAKPEAKIEAKPEAKIEAKIEPKVEAKVEAKPEAKADAKAKDAKADAKKPEAKDAKADAKKPEAKDAKADAKKPEAKDAKADAKTDAKKPEAKPAVELPKKAPDEKKVVPPAPKSGTSPVLIGLLVVVILAAGAFVLWKFVLDKPAEGEVAPVGTLAPVGSGGSAVGSAAPAAPVAPAEPPSKLAVETPAPAALTVLTAGVIESIEPNDTIVKPGDVVARLAGGKPLQAEIATLTKDIETRIPGEIAKLKTEIAAAEPAGDQAALATLKAKLADREETLGKKKPEALAAKQAELERFTVVAKTAGKLAATVKAGDHVAASQGIATITTDPVLVATFKAKEPAPAVGAPLALVHTASGKTIECTVADVKDGTVKVSCANDPLAAVKADDDVTLK